MSPKIHTAQKADSSKHERHICFCVRPRPSTEGSIPHHHAKMKPCWRRATSTLAAKRPETHQSPTCCSQGWAAQRSERRVGEHLDLLYKIVIIYNPKLCRSTCGGETLRCGGGPSSRWAGWPGHRHAAGYQPASARRLRRCRRRAAASTKGFLMPVAFMRASPARRRGRPMVSRARWSRPPLA